LASPFKLSTPLGVRVDADVEQLVELTDTQAAMLGFLGDRQRAVITGSAGSGKTVLALEQARRLRDQGFSVLLTCFNEPLAEFLARRAGEGIEVLNFHGLCESVAREAEVAPIRPVSDLSEYYSWQLPEAALQAADLIDRRYDAIIVDEAQDLEDDWWIVIEAFLSEPNEEARLFVFRDDNQNLYVERHPSSVPVEEAPFALRQNCRNTRAIHEFVARFHKHPEAVSSKAPEGAPVELIACSGEVQHAQEVRKVLHKVVVDGKIEPSDLVVLTPRAQHRSTLKHGEKLGNFTLVDHRPSKPGEIEVSTIHRFKGLDRKVAILAEIDGRMGINPRALLYVGASRAQAKLYVVFSAEGETAVADSVRELLV
jgi:superfamily I DNA/RNA helicase